VITLSYLALERPIPKLQRVGCQGKPWRLRCVILARKLAPEAVRVNAISAGRSAPWQLSDRRQFLDMIHHV